MKILCRVLAVAHVVALVAIMNMQPYCRPISSAEAASVFGGIPCDGQELKNRCGHATTDCSAPNNDSFCQESTDGDYCDTVAGGGQYEGTGTVMGCFYTGAEDKLCVGVGPDESQCTATTRCYCSKPLFQSYSCRRIVNTWQVVGTEVEEWECEY